MTALPTITALPTPPATTDDSTTFNTRAFAIFNALANVFIGELNAFGTALPAVATGTNYSGNSVTSLTIGTGSKSLTIDTGRNFQVGQPVRIAYTTTPANFMDGQVTSYDSSTGAMVVNVTSVGGSGTQALWTIALVPGAGGSFATLTGTETLTNKTLTAPVIATISNSGTVTLPTGTRTLVARDTTDTLTNKTIDTAGTNTIKVNGNTLAASAGSATITFFNSSDTVVGRATTDTLTNKTLTAPTINGGTFGSTGTITAAVTVSDTGTIAAASPGFRGMPSSAQAQGSAITLALTDAAKSVQNTLGGWTIPANASIAFPIGTVIELFNNSASSQTVAITSDTLRLAGTASTGSRTIAQYGSGFIVKRTSTMWTISGAGVS